MFIKYSMTHLEILEVSFFFRLSSRYCNSLRPQFNFLKFLSLIWFTYTYQITLMTHFFINWSLAFSICRMQRFWKVPNSIESTLLWNSLISINRRPLNKQNKVFTLVHLFYIKINMNIEKYLKVKTYI